MNRNHTFFETFPVGTFHGGEELPTGTFHGGEELPTGTFHGGEELPTGTFHGGEELPTGTFHGGEELPTGTFHGGEELPTGTFHGGEELPTGTFHGGEELPTGTFHGGEELPTGTFHGGEELPTGTFHGGEELPTGTFHGGEELPTGTFHGGEELPTGTFHGGEELPTGTFHAHKQENTVKTKYCLSEPALYQVLQSIGTQKPEQGGALGLNPETGMIERFYHDATGSRSASTYSPDTAAVNAVIREWEAEGIRFVGMLHSHPGNYGSPSNGDQRYAEQILKAMPETLKGRFFLPIATVDDYRGTATIRGYEAILMNGGCSIRHVDLYVEDALLSSPVNVENYMQYCVEKGVVTEEEAADTAPGEAETAETEPTAAAAAEPAEAEADEAEAAETEPAMPNRAALFQRNASLLPLDELAARTVVVIGCGGARGFCESLARSAVGRFVLVDGDTVSETNVATQGTYVDEIGLWKTEVIARNLRRINPYVQVTEVRRFLDDSLSDEELAGYIGTELLSESPETVLLCGCTDNFPAQDRTVKLALKWGVPYLASQTYAEGRGGEVLFTYPGLTSACPRCMTSSRYRAYAQGSVNTVTSEGAPIYSTERLNALKSHAALMLLLYGTGSRLGDELKAVSSRNLILASFAADCEEKLGIRAFSRTLAALDDDSRAAFSMEETVWLEQKPDRPENGYPHCPYCAGTGDLRLVRGLIADTRKPFDLTPLLNAALSPQNAALSPQNAA